MPETANTAIKVCSRACLLAGIDPITSFSDGTAESDICNAMYEDIAQSSLTNTRWRFATNQSVLNRIVSPPTARFSAAYQLPSGTLTVSAVTVNGNLIEFDTYGNKIYCDASPTDEVIADYIFRSSEAEWPAYFTIAVEYAMASVLAISALRDASMSQILTQRAGVLMLEARSRDSQRQTTRRLNTSRFIAQRRT